MSVTTIAVDVRVHARLAEAAARHGRTLGQEVEQLLFEREAREILVAGAQIIADPRNARAVHASISPAVAWMDEPNATAGD